MKSRIEKIPDNQWFIFALRLILGGIFLAASVTKLQQQTGFIDTVTSYGILSDGLARVYGLVVPWAELFIGCCLILGIFSRFASALSIPLVLSFMVASSYALFNPVTDDCGCFGEVISLSLPVALSLDVAMLSMALLLLFTQARREFLSTGSLLSRYSLGSGRRRLIFEKASKIVVIAIVMVVVIPFIGGTEIALEPEIDRALEQGKPVFLYFYYEGCSACEDIKPTIDELEWEYEDRIAFMHIDYAEAYRAGQKFEVVSTPTILLITGKDDEGQYIVSQRFVGVIAKEMLQDSLEQALQSKN